MPRTAVARRVAARAENRCIAEEFEAKALQIGLQGDEPAPRERATDWFVGLSPLGEKNRS
jgi:hypothetical protein